MALDGKPYGVLSVDDHDAKALSEEQQQKLDQLKIQKRVENEQYLRSHPEVQLLLQGFMKEVLNKQPDDVREFAAAYYTDPTLPQRINEQKRVLEATSKRLT